MKANLQALCIIVVLLISSFSIYGQRIQAIHAVGDPGLDTVDVYISIDIITIAIQDIPYRTGFPMSNVFFPNQTINIGVAPGNSSTINDTVANFQTVLLFGETYAGVVRGVENPAQFAPNPNGLDISIGLTLVNSVREVSTTPGQTQFIFSHSATDLETVDVSSRSGNLIADNISYGDMSSYVTIAPAMHVFEIISPARNVIYAFDVDLTNYADSAMVFFLSGFADPAQNQNGLPIGLNAILPSGNILEFPANPTGIDDDLQDNLILKYTLAQNYPNPFNPETTIEFSIPTSGKVSLSIFNTSGQHVQTLLDKSMSAGGHQVRWNAAQLPSGVYFYRLKAGSFTTTKKLVLLQ